MAIEPCQLPHFLGLGAQKAGTTTLHHWLATHPQVFVPPVKELHFFSLHHALGTSWYASHFGAALPGQLLGEITPYYLFHPMVPQRIAALLPHVRCIALLRDPVERALSHYFHARRLGFETLPLREALDAEPHRLAGSVQRLFNSDGRDVAHQELSYLSRSRYDEQLQRYDPWHRDGRLLLLRSEDLFLDSAGTWQRIQEFLRLSPIPLQALPAANAGAGEASGVEPELRLKLKQSLAGTYAFLKTRYGISWP